MCLSLEGAKISPEFLFIIYLWSLSKVFWFALRFWVCLSLEGARISPKFLFLIYAATKLNSLNFGDCVIMERQSLVSLVLIGEYFITIGSIRFFLSTVSCRFSVVGVLFQILFLYFRSRRLL